MNSTSSLRQSSEQSERAPADCTGRTDEHGSACDGQPVPSIRENLSNQCHQWLNLLVHFQKITIVGLGLIGGSVALALRRAGYSGEITAWGGSRGIEQALAKKVIDGRERAFDDAKTCDSDLVYLAAPISGILDFLRHRSSQVKPGAIVTDAGSAKREICSLASEALPASVQFVGGHPIAGRELGGFENADAELFANTVYAVVPSARSSQEAINAVEELASACGASALVVSPEEHDRVLALTSHVPQLLSSVLAATVRCSPENDLARTLSGSGFRSMTRLAASPWNLWRDILESNRDNAAAGLKLIEARIREIRSALEDPSVDNRKRLLRLLFEDAGSDASGPSYPRQSSR